VNLNTIVMQLDECVGLLAVHGVGDEVLGSPSVARAADNVRQVRGQYLNDPQLWAMVCFARAWGGAGALPKVWALTD